MMKIFWLYFFTVAFLQPAFSQNLSAYITTLNEFYAFEDSFTHQVDYLKPLNYKVGGNAIAYTDGKTNFRIYQYGSVDAPMKGLVDDYEVSDEYVLIKNPGTLYVYDKGKLVSLSRFVIGYTLADSMVAVVDGASRNFLVYSYDSLRVVEEGNTTDPAARVISSGSNVIAYVTRTNEFKIFYRNRIYFPETQYPKQVKAGSNVVVYLDQYEEGMYVFYKGETKIMEPFNPRLFHVGNDLIAYVDRDGYFKIFSHGNLYEIGNYSPSFLKVEDHLVLYSDRVGYCHVFYNGKSYQLENYIPAGIKFSQNTLFYFDQSNHLKIFSKGVQKTMPVETYVSVNLDYDVLKMQLGGNRYKFFSDGKLYELK